MGRRIWLITGCSTGFGRELAKVVAANGEMVLGTVRKQEHVADLESLDKENIQALILDVTNEDQIESAKKTLDELGGVHVLVNNAGYGSIGPIEETSQEEVQRQFDVNVFGAVRMIKLVLPYMRKQRDGRILNITSIAGLNGFPGVGIYNGSKFALEGIGEALAAEVGHLGVKVTNVEPGPFRTDWAGRSATYVESSIEDYKDTAQKNMESIKSVSGNQIGDPVKAVTAMYNLTKLENPPVHLPLGGPAYNRVNIRLAEFKEEVDKYEYLGKPTDFTEEELAQMESNEDN